MRFPDRDGLTPEERLRNEEAAKCLSKGKYYTFKSPVKATAIPVTGSDAWKPRELAFKRGYYLGFVNGQHLFRGKPLVRPADIPETLAESYFHILFIGGPVAYLDRDQSA